MLVVAIYLCIAGYRLIGPYNLQSYPRSSASYRAAMSVRYSVIPTSSLLSGYTHNTAFATNDLMEQRNILHLCIGDDM